MKKFSRLSFFVAAFLFLTQVTQAVFTDVASNHKYYDAINYLQENGIVEGYEDGSFRPDAKVNRAEALKIILLGSDILVPEIAQQDIFPDVLHGTWYAKFAAKAKNLGIVSGDSDTGMFRPGDTVNLAEILKILLETNDVELRTEEDMERRPYADVPTDAWFAPYFDYADSINLLEEDEDYNVFPSTQVTRGLMAQLMYQLQMKPEGYQEGEASYYGEKFHGKGTASGEVFDASGLTAAHRTLPFGTWLRVRNVANGKEVYVRVNDRGPYAGENRIIDLSKAAFESIASLSSGVIQVSITPVSGPPGDPVPQASADCPGVPKVKYYSESTFENITLATSLPNTYLADEVFFLEGSSASDHDEVSAFLAGGSGDQSSFVAETKADGSFGVPVFFPETGDYQLGLLPGQSGSSVVEDITVLPTGCLISLEDSSLAAPTNLKLKVEAGDLVISWNNEVGYDASKLTFIQGSKQKEYLLRNLNELIPYYADFEGWEAGEIQLQVRSAQLDGASFLDAESVKWSPPLNLSFQAETHHVYTVEQDKVKVLSLPDSLSSGKVLTFKVDPKTSLDERGQVILPTGQVEEVLLESPTHLAMEGNLGINIFPATANDVRLVFKPKSNGLHFFEINDEQGIATVNIPVYPNKVYPLIPNIIDLSSLKPEPLTSDLGSLKNEMLKLVNADRAEHGLSPVVLDSSLNQLAQSRSDDMADRDYFGHWNPEGLTANDLRKDFAIAQFVSENIARDVNVGLAQHGLMRSASHRSNILSDEWQRAGFGFTQDGGNGTIFVQIFSDDPIDFSQLPSLRTELVSALNDERSANLSAQGNLNNLAQEWAEKWVSEIWCDIKNESCNPLTAPNDTFTDLLRDGGVNETLGAYYRGDSSFENAKKAIAENSGMQDPRWKNIGIGLIQDDFGIIQIFITYTE